jgi:hypothetical protein
MWLELGKERPGGVPQNNPRIWVNTDHIVRVEFIGEGAVLAATVISTKPGGSDRTIFKGDDATRLLMALKEERLWQPLLDYEMPAEPDTAVKKPKK